MRSLLIAITGLLITHCASAPNWISAPGFGSREAFAGLPVCVSPSADERSQTNITKAVSEALNMPQDCDEGHRRIVVTFRIVPPICCGNPKVYNAVAEATVFDRDKPLASYSFVAPADRSTDALLKSFSVAFHSIVPRASNLSLERTLPARLPV